MRHALPSPVVLSLLMGAALGLLSAPPARAEDEKPRLLVMNLEAASGISDDDALTLTQLVTVEASDAGVFRTVSYKDLQTMVALEGERQAMGCSDTSCLADLAGAIGARYVMYGRLSKLGSRTILQLNLIDSEAAKPLSREAAKAKDLGQLADQLPTIVATVLDPALRQVSPKVADERRKAIQLAAQKVSEPDPEPEPEPAHPKVTKPDYDPVPFEEVSDLHIVAGDPPELTKVRSTKKIDGVDAIAGIEATFIVEGTPDEVMDAVWQLNTLHEVLPGASSAEIKREGQDKRRRPWAEVILRDKIVLVRLATTVRLIRDNRKQLITFTEVEGDAKYMRGRFRLKEAHQRGFTIVTYRLVFSVGMMVPSSWVRRALEDQPAEMAEVVRERVSTARATRTAKAKEKDDKASKAKSRKKKRRSRRRRR